MADTDRSVSALSAYMLKGYTLLGESCHKCDIPLVRAPNSKKEICVSCEILENDAAEAKAKAQAEVAAADLNEKDTHEAEADAAAKRLEELAVTETGSESEEPETAKMRAETEKPTSEKKGEQAEDEEPTEEQQVDETEVADKIEEKDEGDKDTPQLDEVEEIHLQFGTPFKSNSTTATSTPSLFRRFGSTKKKGRRAVLKLEFDTTPVVEEEDRNEFGKRVPSSSTDAAAATRLPKRRHTSDVEPVVDKAVPQRKTRVRARSLAGRPEPGPKYMPLPAQSDVVLSDVVSTVMEKMRLFQRQIAQTSNPTLIAEACKSLRDLAHTVQVLRQVQSGTTLPLVPSASVTQSGTSGSFVGGI
ncbi:MAG: hypothetical protein MHM6MM_000076 [Cercozoa sp. M6MM]